MASETRRLWIRLLLQYFAVYALVFATTLAGHFWVVSNGYEPLPALLRLSEPMFAIYQVAFCWAFTQEYLLRGLVIAQARKLARNDAKPLLASLLLSILWMIPIAATAPTLTNGVILVVLGPVLGAGTFALRRMFTTLWAAIAAQFLFISAFYVLI